MQWTLMTTAAGIATYSFTLPDFCNAFSLHATSTIRYAIGEAPAAASTATFAAGGIFDGTTAWITKYIEDGASRTLQIRSDATGVKVEVEVF